MRDSRDRGRPGLIAAAAIALVFLAHAWWLCAVVDDAFITFRYARHLAHGHGWVYNLGDVPVEGFTSVLWVLTSALASLLKIDPVLFAQALGLSASLATMAYAYRAARDRLGLSPAASLVPCAVLAISGPFATWALSGMETSLFALLLLAAAVHATGGLAGGRAFGVAALLVLATLARPEGLGVFGLIVLGLWIARRNEGLATLAVVYLVPVLLLVAWRYATFGDVVPNTFHAKTGLSPFVPLRGLLYALYFAAFYVAPWIPLALVARRAAARADAHPAPAVPARTAAVVGTTLLAGWTAYVVLVGGDYMAMARFFVPVLALVALGVGSAFAKALAGGARAPALAAFALGALVTLLHSTPLDTKLFGRPRAQAGNYAGVVNERYAVARFSAVGRFFDGYRRDAKEELAVKVIGAIGWLADVRVLDMLGLTDKHIARETKTSKPLGLGYPGHERGDLAYVARRRPTYVLLEIDDAPRRVAHPDWGDTETNAILVSEYAVREARIQDTRAGTLWVYFLERLESVARRDR